MKGKISNKGDLVIQRGGCEKTQRCPFETRVNVFCGDWCPLFEEPKESCAHWPEEGDRLDYMNSDEELDLKPITTLSLCKKKLEFIDFTDEREYNGKL